MVTSGWSGTIVPVELQAVDKSDAHNKLSVDPRTVVDTPSLEVHSSHRPAVDITFTPEPVPAGKPFVEKIRAWDTTTGKPWAGLPISVGLDNGCAGQHTGTLKTKTKADGTYQRTLASKYRSVVHCVFVSGALQPGTDPWASVITWDVNSVRAKKYVVYIAAPASAKAGQDVTITGALSPVFHAKTLQLQRYVSGTWRTVNTTQVRASGRYTVIATPPGKATYQYRVYAPGDDKTVGAYSKTVKISGR